VLEDTRNYLNAKAFLLCSIISKRKAMIKIKRSESAFTKYVLTERVSRALLRWWLFFIEARWDYYKGANLKKKKNIALCEVNQLHSWMKTISIEFLNRLGRKKNFLQISVIARLPDNFNWPKYLNLLVYMCIYILLRSITSNLYLKILKYIKLGNMVRKSEKIGTFT